MREELVSQFTFKDLVNLSCVCKFLYTWSHSVCELLEESISGKPKWNGRWVMEEMKMYKADVQGMKTRAQAWPDLSFKFETV